MPEVNDEYRTTVFQQLNPICQRIVKENNIQDVFYLRSVVTNIEPRVIEELQSYLIFPMKFMLLKNVNEKLAIESIDFMTFLFEKTECLPWSEFVGISNLLLSKICDPGSQKSNEMKQNSEELKSSLCLCITQALKSIDYRKLFAPDFRLPLAQLIHTLVQLLHKEKSKKLRLTILDAVAAIAIPPSDESKDLACVGLTCFLPGLSIALMKVAMGDVKQGNDVIRRSLQILSSLLVLVTGDQSVVENNMNSIKCTDTSQPPLVVRNEMWFQEMSEKVLILIQNTIVIQNYNHHNVRLEYLKFSEQVLLHCTRNLHKCINVLLPVVFALSVDEYEEVATYGQKLLNRFIKQVSTQDSSLVDSALEEGLFSTSSKLIRCKLSLNDDEKLSTLRALLGYFKVLDKNIFDVLCSHIEKIVLGLLSLLEVDVSVVGILEEMPSLDLENNVNYSGNASLRPQKHFRFFKKSSILTTVQDICRLLSKKGGSSLLIDFLLEKIHESSLFALQGILLIGYILEGIDCENSEIGELISSVVQSLLSLKTHKSEVHESPNHIEVYDKDKKNRPMEYYDNVELYQMCFTLETLEYCAKVLGLSFKPLLINVLFYVAEKAGSSNYILSQTAQICLFSISASCGYQSIIDLLLDNASYLSNSIVVHSQCFLQRPAMAVALRVAVELGDANVLKTFEDSIYHILDVLDLNQDKAYSIMVVLKTVVTSIKKWFPTQSPKKQQTEEPGCCSLSKYFSDLEAKEKELNNTGAEEVEESFNESQSEVELEKKVAWHVVMLSAILKRCIHLQSSNNTFLCVISLEVMELCIEALHDHPTEQHPLVHELWNPFVHRFSEDYIIVHQAFQVLLVTVNECRDFVRTRILKDIAPKLLKFLKVAFKESRQKSFRSYQWSSSCKLQLSLLENLGDMFTKLDVAEKDIALLTEVCLPYLDKVQPLIISQAASKTIRDLANLDGDAMWYV